MTALSNWTIATDQSSYVNLTATKELRAQMLPISASGVLTPDTATRTWGAFATVEEGRVVQVGAASYTNQAAAVAAILTLTGQA